MKKLFRVLSLILVVVFMTGAAGAFASEGETEKSSKVIDGKNYLKRFDTVWFGADYFAGEGAGIAAFMTDDLGSSAEIAAAASSLIAGSSEDGYIGRFDLLDNLTDKLLIVELTDNDLAGEYEYGRVDYSYDENDYNTDTILGALNYVFKIARDNHMPAVMMTEPSSENEEYKNLIRKVKDLQSKWGFLLLDLRDESIEDINVYVMTEINNYLIDLGGDAEAMFQYAGNLPKYDPNKVGADRRTSIPGLTIIHLGSSVSEGFAADGVSFAEYLAKHNDGTFVKETANGTSMSNYGKGSDRSYINRLANIDPDITADLFLCQLSTNDANKETPIGEISDSDDPADFDLETVAGAIEYIIHYAQDTWHCPIMFYTGVYFDNELYAQMVDLLLEMKNKYDIGVIDLWHNLDVNVPEYYQYMADEKHPTKRGYTEWWGPYMEECIKQYLQPDKSTYDFDGFEDIVTEGLMEEPLVFSKLPSGYNEYITEHRGRSFILHYTTDAYDNGKTYDKFCRVYLPYGYDADDKETKYNVLYFQHGNGNSPNTLLTGAYYSDKEASANGSFLINNLLDPDNGLMDPFIIICPTYYFETPEDQIMTADSSGPAGDGRYEGIAANYYREIVEDLIPQVESLFNVYCEDFSPEGIKASRDHRAFGGYSRGSVCTWYMFHHDLEYFRYFLPMSADIKPDNTDLGIQTTLEDAYQYLKESIDANPDQDFFIFATSGNPDDAARMRELLPYLASQADTFSFGQDTAANNLFYCCSDFSHNMLYAPYSLYNARNILFK